MPRKIFIRSRHPSHNSLRENRIRTRTRTVFRLGSTSEGSYDNEINCVEGIVYSSDKYLMKESFDIAEIKHTEWSTEPLDVYPQLSKPRFGSRGEGIIKYDSNAGMRRNCIYEKFYSGSREYRLTVSVLGCFLTVQKLRNSNADNRWMVNDANGCIWVTKRKPIFRNERFAGFGQLNDNFKEIGCFNEIVTDCQKALTQLGCDILAFDVKVNSTGTDYRILESNSAPSIGRVSLPAYIDELQKIVREYQY